MPTRYHHIGMTTSSLVTERALARTYNSRSYADTWEAVEDYRRVIEYAQKYPGRGSSAIASKFELPRGRIRPWLEDSKPDAVRGIDTARDYGWLDCEFDGPIFQGLNTLVANVFSGGSIAERNYSPSFALNHRKEDSHIFDALELVGIEYEIVADREDRGDEVRPTEDGTVLGRVLAVLGAPVGPKADQHLSLPTYLESAPSAVREQFVFAYLENRAIPREGKDTMTIREQRNRQYLQELSDLIEQVAGERTRLGDKDIVISAAAARSLGTVR